MYIWMYIWIDSSVSYKTLSFPFKRPKKEVSFMEQQFQTSCVGFIKALLPLETFCAYWQEIVDRVLFFAIYMEWL